MVAGERRRPAASSTGETVIGSPPNRTTDGARRLTGAPACSPAASPPDRALTSPGRSGSRRRQPDTRPAAVAGVSGAAAETVATRREGTLVGPRAVSRGRALGRLPDGASLFGVGRTDRERAPLLFMTTVLLDAEQPGETDQCLVVGEDADDVGAPADLLDRGDGGGLSGAIAPRRAARGGHSFGARQSSTSPTR